ncbi:hypothetical protein KSS87_002189 [Heliosperma pusillum]|nr:hypothetical protein KSS87_002189 [Heliosperma pusillum]
MNLEEDVRIRTGTVWTATAHAVTAVIGSGVLAVPWSVAQMGWIFGPLSLFGFAVITYITARLLCDCYRTPDPVKGQRNPSYMDAVKSTLGKREVFICAVAQFTLLWGTMVGYAITAATSMLSIKRTNCYRTQGPDADCHPSGNSFLLIFGAINIVLCQVPSLEKVTFLSVIAATMSFGYSFIALYLCVAKFTSHPHARGTLIGVEIGRNGITLTSKLWQSFQALGNIAFSYTYAQLLIEIEDTLKAPPAENKTMKRATLNSIALTTAFYVSLGCMGYLAFGNDAPGNVLTAFREPFWLVDLANVGVVIHLTAAFQVLLGLLGSVAFWPLTVYLPVTMYTSLTKIKKGEVKWFMLQGLSLLAFVVSLVSGVGSIADIADRLRHTKLFSANL